MFTNAETRNHRLNMCNECEMKKDIRCAECGCFLILLHKTQSAKCPLGKW